MTEGKAQSDAMVIKRYFLPEMTAGEAMAELKRLTPEDKVQLGEGIRSGSYSY